jgi:hypothetical protein
VDHALLIQRLKDQLRFLNRTYPAADKTAELIILIPTKLRAAERRKGRGDASRANLLNFRFFEIDVLLNNRVVLLESKLFCQVPRILVRYIIVTRAGGAD